MAGSRAAVADRDQERQPVAEPAVGLARVGQLLTPVLETWLGLARVAVLLEPGPAAVGEPGLCEDEADQDRPGSRPEADEQ
jgi:hypothetical protein